MTRAGMYGDSGTVAHHIVQRGGDMSEPARAVLRKHGIDLDSHWNGVYLPENSMSSTARAVVHNQKGSALTSRWYHNLINDRITRADAIGGRSRVLNELRLIRRDLQAFGGSFEAVGARWNYFGGGLHRQ